MTKEDLSTHRRQGARTCVSEKYYTRTQGHAAEAIERPRGRRGRGKRADSTQQGPDPVPNTSKLLYPTSNMDRCMITCRAASGYWLAPVRMLYSASACLPLPRATASSRISSHSLVTHTSADPLEELSAPAGLAAGSCSQAPIFLRLQLVRHAKGYAET